MQTHNIFALMFLVPIFMPIFVMVLFLNVRILVGYFCYARANP